MSSVTRSALKEIPPMNSLGNVNNTLNIIHQLPPTPPSPEEQVIQQRGKRKTSVQACLEDFLQTPNMSPSKTRTRTSPRKLLTPTRTSPRTPNKQNILNRQGTPSKQRAATLPTRTSPRKRLNLSFDSPSESDPGSSQIKVIQVAKRMRREKKPAKTTNFETTLKALTQDQLVQLVKNLLDKHPELEDDAIEAIPAPDLDPLEQQLKYLQRNIYKSFPYTRWGSSRDAFCYRRVCTHLEAFKKTCIEQGRRLVESQHWNAVIDYVTMAWDYVHKMPNWDNPSHNRSKGLCFKGLGGQCMNALKKSKSYFDKQDLQEIIQRLEELEDDEAKTLTPVIQHAKQLLQQK